VNPTAQKRDFCSYYTPEIREHARWIFGPFLRKWGYEFPPEWGVASVPLPNQVLFRGLAVYRNLRRRYFLTGTASFVRSAERLLEHLSLLRYRGR
jgi:hypothetical protein